MARNKTTAGKGNRLARKHGAYAFEARGTAALDAGQLQTYTDIQEYTATHEGLVALLRERAARAEMIARILEDHVNNERRAGVPVGELTGLSKLSTYQEGARRAIQAALSVTPEPVASYDLDDWLSGRVTRDDAGNVVEVALDETEGGQDGR